MNIRISVIDLTINFASLKIYLHFNKYLQLYQPGKFAIAKHAWKEEHIISLEDTKVGQM